MRNLHAVGVDASQDLVGELHGIFGGVEQGYMQGNSNTGVSYLVTGTAAGRPLSVTGGSNNELFTVSGLANDFPAGVTINGGGGIDQLTADDSGLSGNSTYQITAGQIQKDNGFAGLAYSNINRLDVVAETGNNAVNVNDAGQLNTINIDAGAGNNTIKDVDDWEDWFGGRK
jgi:hypothetical protein